MFTGTGGFDGGVQRQQVGLRGNIFDGFDNGADLFGAFAHLLHFFGRSTHFGFDALHALQGFFNSYSPTAGGFGGRGRIAGD